MISATGALMSPVHLSFYSHRTSERLPKLLRILVIETVGSPLEAGACKAGQGERLCSHRSIHCLMRRNTFCRCCRLSCSSRRAVHPFILSAVTAARTCMIHCFLYLISLVTIAERGSLNCQLDVVPPLDQGRSCGRVTSHCATPTNPMPQPIVSSVMQRPTVYLFSEI